MTAPSYRVQVFAMGASFGIGNLIAELENVKNIGWSDHLNDVPEAFFTVNQEDPKIALLRGYQGKAHVRIIRNDDIVWAGKFGHEFDAKADDVIFTAYGYLAHTYSLLSDWNKTYTNTSMGTIISDAWTRAKTGIANSPLAFVTTGTIETPVTTSGGATGITLPRYQEFYKRLLFVFREMATIATSDTTNTVVYEITHSATPTFNYWKNRGVQKPNVQWEFGDGYVRDFKVYGYPIYHRNDLLTVGAAANNTTLRYEASDATDITNWGAHQEPVYFSWIRDSTELQRVAKLRLAVGLREQADVSLTFFANTVLPPGATGAGFRLSDQVKVKIDRGFTNINSYQLTVGVRVLYVNGNEHVRVELQTPSGS